MPYTGKNAISSHCGEASSNRPENSDIIKGHSVNGNSMTTKTAINQAGTFIFDFLS